MTTVDGDDWLYDVHVYPKNKTTYGGVTLEKHGKNGAKLEGVTFVLQKRTQLKINGIMLQLMKVQINHWENLQQIRMDRLL